MEPEIRYVRTQDGVNIAYYALGHGPPVVVLRLPLSHLLFEWRQDEEDAAMWAATASVATLIRLDPRGFGLSQRDVTDFSVDRLVSDIEAVVAKLGLSSFALVSNGASSPVALAYAARHPAHVSRLVLSPGFDRITGKAWKQWDLLASSAETDWDFASEAMIRTIRGWNAEEWSKSAAAFLRETITPSSLKAYLQAAGGWDVSGLVPSVKAPTLVTQDPTATYTTIEGARALVSALPDGRLFLTTEGTPEKRSQETLAATSRFLGGDTELFSKNARAPSTAIILFADIVESTALTERMGDAAFREKARALDAALRFTVRDNGGATIDGKLLGDGILATFPAASQAIMAALTFDRTAAASGLQLHVGLHAGDIIREQDNVYGGAVNIAARISALAAPAEVLVSDTVRSLARTSAGVTFEDRGEHALKGIADPQRVFAVRTMETS